VGTSKNVLLIITERPTWDQSRPLAYTANWAIEDGLKALGHNVYTIVVQGDGTINPDQWVVYGVNYLYKDIKFDMMFIELMHARASEQILAGLADLIPVRVAYLIESMTTSQCYGLSMEHILRKLNFITHVLPLDEYDIKLLGTHNINNTMWFPCNMPEKFLVKEIKPYKINKCLFFGKQYQRRASMLQQLKDLVEIPEPAENKTTLPEQFDRLATNTCRAFITNSMSNKIMRNYIDENRDIRLGVEAVLMNEMRQYKAVLGLPSTFLGYTSRVVESMIAGVPVVAWVVPDRPEANATFTHEKNILLYNDNPPHIISGDTTEVRKCITLLDNQDYRNTLAANALDVVKEKLTSEVLLNKFFERFEL
jgi:hypothetical protein